MLVTFVSQCDKKAIKRTRRVLDAFADRIGDFTWQTLITEDGLLMVKKLLRQSATKNTAVTCHWRRSSRYSELLWIVGNRNHFNMRGLVPVNRTSKELFMDIKEVKPEKGVVYANTHLQRLDQHLFAVGYLACEFYKRLINYEENHAKLIYFAGLLHDIGKNEPNYQQWVIDPKVPRTDNEDGQHIEKRGFSFEDYPRHNELSALIFESLNREVNVKGIKRQLAHMAHTIYWHHALPFRRNKKSKLFSEYGGLNKLFFEKTKILPSQFYGDAIKLLKQVENIAENYGFAEFKALDFLQWVLPSASFDEEYKEFGVGGPIPSFKTYSEFTDKADLKGAITENALNNIMRTCVITADRKVSHLKAHELDKHIACKTLHELVDNALEHTSNLDNQIYDALQVEKYDLERNIKQAEAAQKLAKQEDIAILSGAAGSGKTKIALEWANLKKAKKLFWICPRVQVCQGIFTELTQQYLPHTQIEIYTGEFKYTNQWDNITSEKQYLTADIVVTTIDQILHAITSHTKVDSLIEFLNAHVVFDEYHEFVNMPAFNLLFAELVKCKAIQKNQSTLLVSATPNPYFIEHVLCLDTHSIVEMPSFNQNLYKIEFIDYDENRRDETNPFYAPQPLNTFVISNTAQTAQISFAKNHATEKSILFHSKYKKSDKKWLFEEVYESFKKEGTLKYEILRSGPIVQASLNISCQHMISEITMPEDMLQRLGRLDRFEKNKNGVNILKVAIPRTMTAGKSTGNSARFLSRRNCYRTTKIWWEFLQNSLPEHPLTLKEIYKFYDQFYKMDTTKKHLEEDFEGVLRKSIHLINQKIVEPIKISRNGQNNGNAAKISSRSLRGDNVFVQMAECNLDQFDKPEVLNKYAYEIPLDDITPADSLTASLDEVQGYGKSDKNLVAHMFKKHHNIKGVAKSYKDYLLLKEARNDRNPIYLSYTPNDLISVGGDRSQHHAAVFYCVCEKQSIPIGALALNCLNNFEDDSDE